MYAPVLKVDGYEFFVDCRRMRRPPTVLVRTANDIAEIWLGPPIDVEMPGHLSPKELDRILAIAERHSDQLFERWYHLREDVRRERLEDRNPIVHRI